MPYIDLFEGVFCFYLIRVPIIILLLNGKLLSLLFRIVISRLIRNTIDIA